MGKKLYIGNLPYSADDAALQSIFAQAGTVSSATVIFDRATGRSRGFGFVEMANDNEAADAIQKFNGADYDGRPMIVSEAKPEGERPRREGGGGGAGGRGGYGGGGGGGRGGDRGGRSGGGGGGRY